MDFLPMQNKVCEGDARPNDFISAEGKDVVIIGGGDTGADCLGTVNRQGAKSVHQLEILPKPPNVRAEDNPWPEWPRIFRTASAHEEGVERVYSVSTKKFVDGDRWSQYLEEKHVFLSFLAPPDAKWRQFFYGRMKNQN